MVSDEVTDRRLLKAIRYVACDLTKRPSLAQVARAVGLQHTYFCRLFRLEVGLSFSVWDRQLRVDRSKDLLAATRLPITSIAMVVGYKDVTTFERNFRKCEAMTPRAYRKTHRGRLPRTQ